MWSHREGKRIKLCLEIFVALLERLLRTFYLLNGGKDMLEKGGGVGHCKT